MSTSGGRPNPKTQFSRKLNLFFQLDWRWQRVKYWGHKIPARGHQVISRKEKNPKNNFSSKMLLGGSFFVVLLVICWGNHKLLSFQWNDINWTCEKRSGSVELMNLPVFLRKRPVTKISNFSCTFLNFIFLTFFHLPFSCLFELCKEDDIFSRQPVIDMGKFLQVIYPTNIKSRSLIEYDSHQNWNPGEQFQGPLTLRYLIHCIQSHINVKIRT